MALAVTHVILTIVIVSIYRHYFAKPKFSRWYVLLAAFAALFPDIDYPLSFLFDGYIYHGMFHLVYVGLLFLLAAIIFYYAKLPRKYYLISAIVAFGFLFHLLLDCASGGYEFFLPFSVMNYCSPVVGRDFWPAADAVILLLWLTHEFYAHKIKDFF